MIVEKDFRKLVHQLIKDEAAQIQLGGSDLTVHVLDNATKIFLSTPVYLGDNFIPKSVRASLSKKPSFEHEHVAGYLSVNEEHSSVALNYLGRLDHLKKRMFIDLLEDFSSLAEEWRLYLDENDKHDLIHVRIPKP